MSNNYNIIDSYGKGSLNIRGEFLFLNEDPNLCKVFLKEKVDLNIYEGEPPVPQFPSPPPSPTLPVPLPTVTPTPSPLPECCLLDSQINLLFYPNAAITQQKLPPSIIFEGNTLSLGSLGYGNTTNGVFYETDTWAVYKSGIRVTRRCLISDVHDDIQDNFPNTLYLTYTLFGVTVTATLNRTSLCLYEGTDNFGCQGVLSYNYGEELFSSEGNNWVLQGFSFVEEIFVPNTTCGLLTYSTNLDQNTPQGTYTGVWGYDSFGNDTTVNITITP